MDNDRLLQYAVIGLGLVIWFVLWCFLRDLVNVAFQYFNWTKEVPILGKWDNVVLLLSAGITFGGVMVTIRNPVANKFGIECVSELRKVSWPNWKEIKGTTLVVIGVSVVVSIILWVFDKIFGTLLDGLYRWF